MQDRHTDGRGEASGAQRCRGCEGTGRNWTGLAPRNAGSHQKLEGVRKESSLEPLEGAQPCQHLDFGLENRERIEYISVVYRR